MECYMYIYILQLYWNVIHMCIYIYIFRLIMEYGMLLECYMEVS